MAELERAPRIELDDTSRMAGAPGDAAESCVERGGQVLLSRYSKDCPRNQD